MRDRRGKEGEERLTVTKEGMAMEKKKILIVDDSELVLHMAKDALTDAGYDVAAVATSVDANRYIFSTNKPDLIIMDVMMPMMDGDKKVKFMSERESSRNIPVLLMSSKPEEEMRRLVAESGAKGYILKPFTSSSIVNSVRNYLGEE